MTIFMANAEKIGYRTDTQTKYIQIAQNDLMQILSNFKNHKMGNLQQSHLGFAIDPQTATNRLDSRYFDPRITALIERLRRFPHLQLGRVITYCIEGKAPRKYVDDGVPVITIENIVKRYAFYFVDLTDVKHITIRAHEQARASKIRTVDLLLAITGATIGKVAVAPKGLKEANICGDILKIEVDAGTLNPYYIAAFLSSAHGQIQIFRHIYGSTNMHLDTEGIKSILIPLHPNQDQIGRQLAKIEEAYEEASVYVRKLSTEMANFLSRLA